MAEIKDPINAELLKSPGKYAAELLKVVNALDDFITIGERLIALNAKVATSDDTTTTKKKKLTAVEVEANRIKKAQLATDAKLAKARSAEVIALTKTQVELKKANAAVLEGITGTKAAIAAKKKLTEATNAKNKALRLEYAETKKQKSAVEALNKQRTKALIAIQKDINAKRKSVLATQLLKGTLKGIKAELAANVAKWELYTPAQLKSDKAAKKLTATIKKQRSALSKAEASTGQATRGVGKYKEGVLGAAQSLFGALGLIGGIAGLVKVFSSAIIISLKFEAAMSKVKAVSGATSIEYKALKDQAKLLGEQTQKTAVDAAQLQLELSKIGFSPKQIINSTNAILELSIATGEDLAQSAKVAAGTLKSFNKDAEDAQEITDIMAKSFSSSALDLSKFETAVSAAGPTLNAMGVSVERMTAQLSVLVDRNIDASTAGTGLRNVYLDLNKHGMTLTEALEDINNSSNKANRAFELFGKRGATVAVVLAENQEQADKLTRSYEMAGGSAKKMAAIMIDNLKGDTDKATSAMQGLAINLGERLTPSLRSATQGFTNIVSALSEFAKIGNEDLLKEEQLNVNKLAIELTNANTTLIRRNEIYEELQDIAPEVIENIDFENVSIVTLRGNLEKYNQTLIKKLALSETEVLKSDANIKASEALEERLKKEDNARSLLFNTQQKANGQGGEFKKTIDGIILSSIPLEEKLVKTKEALASQVDGFGKSQLEMAKFRTQTGLFNDAIRELTIAQTDEEKATQKASDAVQAYTDRYNRIFGTDAVTTGVDEFIQGLMDIEDQLDDIEFDKKFSAFQDQSINAILKSTKKSSSIMKKFRDDELKANTEEFRWNAMLNKEEDDLDKDSDAEYLKRKKALDSELNKNIKANSDFTISEAKRKRDQEIASAEMVKDATIDLTAQGAQAITDLLLEASSQRRDEELDAIEEKRDEDLERIDKQTEEDLAKEDAKVEAETQTEEEATERKNRIQAAADLKSAKIEEEADARSAAIQTKQAKAEKAASIASVAINTAVSIIKAFAQLGPIGGAAITPFLIGAGAIQTAAILATPIPKFFKGIDSAPSGIISTAEKGQELVIPKGGNPFLTPDTQTFYSDLQGAEIVPNHKVKERLADMGAKGQSFNFSDAAIVSELRKNTKAVKRQGRSNTVDSVTTTKIGNRLIKKHNSLLANMKR